MKPIGRPKLPDEVRRKRSINLKMTEAERQQTVEAATRAGISFSEYVRRHGLASMAIDQKG